MDWDSYFLQICNVVASNSKCLSRQIGAIIVEDRRIISEGYNGPPEGFPHCGLERIGIDHELRTRLSHIPQEKLTKTCPRRLMGFKSGEGLEWCPAGHAERNAIVSAARLGIRVKGTVMYMNCGVPCAPCLVEIINSGIKEVVCTDLVYYDRLSPLLVENSNLVVRTYDLEG